MDETLAMIHIQNPDPRSVIELGMVHANVPSAVYEYLKSVFPGHGNIQAVTCTLINQLVLALKSNGIERYDLENEQLILSVLVDDTPIIGLLEKPVHEMSDEERKAFVEALRSARVNFNVLVNKIAREASPKVHSSSKTTAATKLDIFRFVMKKKKLRIVWTCSDQVHHEHRWYWTAWLCGRIQSWLAPL